MRTSSGLRRDFELIEFAGTHLADEGGLFEQVVAGGGEEARLWGWLRASGRRGPTRCMAGGDGARGGDLADEVDVADIDAEFERCCGDEEFDLAGLESLLGVEAQLARERAMVRADVLGTQAFGEREGNLLHQAARVDKHERGAVLECELRQGGCRLVPHGVGGDGAEFVAGDFDGEVELAALSDLDDGALAMA